MPRHYKKTTARIDDQNLMNKVMELSLAKVSKQTGVARETVRRWVLGGVSRVGSGRTTILMALEEAQIAAALRYSADLGHPLKREDLKLMVQSFVTSQKRKTPFADGKPGNDFCRGFEARHPEIGKQIPELVTEARNHALSAETLDRFFLMYENLLDQHNLRDQPHRIFNLDETGLNANPVNGKVYVEKGKSAVVLNANCGKTSYSVMFCISADGKYLPPFVIYKGAHLYDNWTRGGPKDAVYTATESGWMQDKNFEQWITNVFVKHVEDVQKPVLLLFDGHGSHLTFPTVDICMRNQILLLCLPPHTSHALQPLDVAVFRPLKIYWRDILENFRRQARKESVDKNIFPALLKRLFEQVSVRPDLAISGFLGAGLCPVDKSQPMKKVVQINEEGPLDTPRKAMLKVVKDILSPSIDPDIAAAIQN